MKSLVPVLLSWLSALMALPPAGANPERLTLRECIFRMLFKNPNSIGRSSSQPLPTNLRSMVEFIRCPQSFLLLEPHTLVLFNLQRDKRFLMPLELAGCFPEIRHLILYGMNLGPKSSNQPAATTRALSTAIARWRHLERVSFYCVEIGAEEAGVLIDSIKRATVECGFSFESMSEVAVLNILEAISRAGTLQLAALEFRRITFEHQTLSGAFARLQPLLMNLRQLVLQKILFLAGGVLEMLLAIGKLSSLVHLDLEFDSSSLVHATAGQNMFSTLSGLVYCRLCLRQCLFLYNLLAISIPGLPELRHLRLTLSSDDVAAGPLLHAVLAHPIRSFSLEVYSAGPCISPGDFLSMFCHPTLERLSLNIFIPNVSATEFERAKGAISNNHVLKSLNLKNSLLTGRGPNPAVGILNSLRLECLSLWDHYPSLADPSAGLHDEIVAGCNLGVKRLKIDLHSATRFPASQLECLKVYSYHGKVPKRFTEKLNEYRSLRSVTVKATSLYNEFEDLLAGLEPISEDVSIRVELTEDLTSESLQRFVDRMSAVEKKSFVYGVYMPVGNSSRLATVELAPFRRLTRSFKSQTGE